MRVKALYANCQNVEADIEKFNFFLESELELSIGSEYEVYAVSVFEGGTFYQIVDDTDWPSWLPAIFFEISENSIPNDWLCNYFISEPSLLVGPYFIVKSIDSYNRMVQLESKEVDMFWARIKKK